MGNENATHGGAPDLQLAGDLRLADPLLMKRQHHRRALLVFTVPSVVTDRAFLI